MTKYTEIIKDAMKEAGVSLRDMAEVIEVSHQFINQCVRGDCSMPVYLQSKIVRYLQLKGANINGIHFEVAQEDMRFMDRLNTLTADELTELHKIARGENV